MHSCAKLATAHNTVHTARTPGTGPGWWQQRGRAQGGSAHGRLASQFLWLERVYDLQPHSAQESRFNDRPATAGGLGRQSSRCCASGRRRPFSHAPRPRP
eukprot:scaffold250_cov110-Isochrysis_galbana.AAC.13